LSQVEAAAVFRDYCGRIEACWFTTISLPWHAAATSLVAVLRIRIQPETAAVPVAVDGRWTLFALHYLGAALAQWVPDTPLQTALDRWLYAMAAVFFFLGAHYIPSASHGIWCRGCGGSPWRMVGGERSASF